MATWHQEQSLPTLYHATKWTCYNPSGHLSVMRFDDAESAQKYADNTGDVILPPSPQK
jgi:hypothetical protein